MKKVVLPILVLLLVLSFSNVSASNDEKNVPLQNNGSKSMLKLLCYGDESGDFFCVEEEIESENVIEKDDSVQTYDELTILSGVLVGVLLFAFSLILLRKVIKS